MRHARPGRFGRLSRVAGVVLVVAGIVGWMVWRKTPTQANEPAPSNGGDRHEPPAVVPPVVSDPVAVAPAAPAPAPAPTQPASESAPDRSKAMVTELGGGRFRVGVVEFDKNRRVILIPAAVQMREGPVEYLLVTRGGKVHETVLVTDADPRDVHLAALLLGMRPEADLGPASGAVARKDHGAVTAWLEWDRNGPPAREDLGALVVVKDPASGVQSGNLGTGWWLYNGSRVEADGVFAAKRSGSLISIIRDQDALINHPGSTRDQDDIHTPNATKLPKIGHPVRVVLQLR